MTVVIDRRGACPALSAPMQTGDGLLVRLNPVSEGLTPKQLIGLCESAARHGNGTVEITARGSFQIRGLRAHTVPLLADDVNRLGIEVRTGVPVDISPLAGLDPTEIADPRPLAAAIRQAVAAAGLTGRLGPKVSVVVDGGGVIGLADVIADVRLVAGRRRTGALWRMALGGAARTATPMGASTENGATGFAVDLLSRIAELGIEARGRDLLDSPVPAAAGIAQSAPRNRAAFALNDGRVALCMALPFGNAEGAVIADLVRQAEALGVGEFRFSPGRMLIGLCPDVQAALQLNHVATGLGFITDPADPHLAISACAGEPACASAHLMTRMLAEQLAAGSPELVEAAGHVHVSGCAKGCAHPTSAGLTLVGSAQGVGVVANGTARSTPTMHLKANEVAARLPELVRAARQRSQEHQ